MEDWRPATSVLTDITDLVTNGVSRHLLSSPTRKTVDDIALHSISLNGLKKIANESRDSDPLLASDAQQLVSKMSVPVVTVEHVRQLLILLAEEKVTRELDNEEQTRILLRFELLSVIDEAIRQAIGLDIEHSEANLNVNRTTMTNLLEGWASSMYLDSTKHPVNADDESGAMKLAGDFSTHGKVWLKRYCDREWHMDPERDKGGEFAKLHAELLAVVPFNYTWPIAEKIRVFERVLDLQDLMVQRCKAAERAPALFFVPLKLPEDAAKQLSRIQELAKQTFGSYETFLSITKEVKATRNWDAHANAFRTLTYLQLCDLLSDDTVALALLKIAKDVARDPNLPLAEMRQREQAAGRSALRRRRYYLDQPGVSNDAPTQATGTSDQDKQPTLAESVRVNKSTQRVSQLVGDWSKRLGISTE